MQEALETLNAPAGNLREIVGLTISEALGLLLILVLLAANFFQLYRARTARRTAATALHACLSNLTGLIGRARARAEALGVRLWNAERAGAPEGAVLREFREFARETEFALRAQYEQLRGVRRLVRRDDRAAGHGDFGPPNEELEQAQRSVGM